MNAICTAYFHEDDYCQWEILPLTAKVYCLKEMGQRTLTTLGQLAPVLLADWGWEQCVELTSPQEIEQYATDKVNNTLRLLEEKKYLENSK